MLRLTRGKLSVQEEDVLHELISNTEKVNSLLLQCKQEREKLDSVLKRSSIIGTISQKLSQMEELAKELDKKIIHITESNVIFDSLEDKVVKLREIVDRIEQKSENLMEKEAILEAANSECDKVNSMIAALRPELEKLKRLSEETLSKANEVSRKKAEFTELFENCKIIFIRVVKDRLRFAYDEKNFNNIASVY